MGGKKWRERITASRAELDGGGNFVKRRVTRSSILIGRPGEEGSRRRSSHSNADAEIGVDEGGSLEVRCWGELGGNFGNGISPFKDGLEGDGLEVGPSTEV